jgi:hypothetical protein
MVLGLNDFDAEKNPLLGPLEDVALVMDVARIKIIISRAILTTGA